jgi:hypothetical protein
MTNNILNETPISLCTAARSVPPHRQDRPVSTSCIFRWMRDGVKLPDGTVVRLEGIRLGGRWLTSKEALQRFAERQTPRFDGPGPQSAKKSGRAADRAGKELERMGA